MFRTISGLKKLNRKNGYYFFSKKTMEFFNCIIESGLIKKIYFITSERYDLDQPKIYTVRKGKADGKVDTIKMGFKDIKDAREYINNL